MSAAPGMATPKSSVLQTVKAVAWAFLGIRKNSDYQSDLGQLHPFHIIAVALVGVALVVMTARHPVVHEKRRMQAYLVLTLGSLVFWSLYQMAPNGLQMFAVGNVWMNVWGVPVAPQWVQNINTVVIVIGLPALIVGEAAIDCMPGRRVTLRSLSLAGSSVAEEEGQ